MRYQNDLPQFADVDVAVVGGGASGCTAAIAAARAGARVLLIERHGFLGGTSTAVLDTFYGFYTPGEIARKVIGGIPDDVVAGLQSMGRVIERPNTFGAGTGVTYHPEHLKVTWERLARESGVRVLLYGVLQDVVAHDGHVDQLVVATKAGLQSVRARVCIDASGDADLCHFAGFGSERAGDVDPAQTLTTTFTMANVNVARRKTVSKDELHARMAAAAESGAYDLPRREGSDHVTPVDHTMSTIMTRLSSYEQRDDIVVTATDPEFLSQAEMEGRRQALEYVRFLIDQVPGYEDAQLISFSRQIGIRETRRVYGDYRLTRDDVLAARQFDDQVGLCGAPIEDHHTGSDTTWHYLPEGQTVGIPYRTLIPADGDNVLVAGRCFSATHDAHASVRSMAQCMAMGQAAGTAAALAAPVDGAVRDVRIETLQDQLRRTGAILDLEPVEASGAA